LEAEPVLAEPGHHQARSGTYKIFDKERLLSYDLIIPSATKASNDSDRPEPAAAHGGSRPNQRAPRPLRIRRKTMHVRNEIKLSKRREEAKNQGSQGVTSAGAFINQRGSWQAPGFSANDRLVDTFKEKIARKVAHV